MAVLLGLDTVCARQALAQNGPAGLEALEQRVMAEVRAGLRSDDDRELAWAAWHAGGMRLVTLAEELERTLERLATQAPIEHRWRVVNGLCVAMIQTGSRITACTLRAWWDQLPAVREELMVLAAGHPREHLGLLRALATEVAPTHAWVAACNLLLEHEPGWLARQLFQDFTLEVEILAGDVCRDREAELGFLGRGEIACARGMGPTGFPPSLECRLGFASDGLTVGRALTLGPEPIVWRWDVATGCRWSWTTALDCRAYALACLLQLARPGAWAELADACRYPLDRDAVIRWSVPWRDPASWQRECRGRLATLREQWARVLVGLCGNGLLPEEAMTKPDVLRIRMLDGRADKTTPLPRIE